MDTVENRGESLWLCHRARDDYLQSRAGAPFASELLQKLMLVKVQLDFLHDEAVHNEPLQRE